VLDVAVHRDRFDDLTMHVGVEEFPIVPTGTFTKRQSTYQRFWASQDLLLQLDGPDTGTLRSVDQPVDNQIDDLNARWQQVEGLVDATPGIDRWCSGPDWVLPAHEAFAPESDPVVFSEDDRGAALLARYEMGPGRAALAGLEPLWGFACPILTNDPSAMGDFLSDELRQDPSWNFLILPGLPASESTAQLAEPLSHLGELRVQAGIVRQVAALRGGPDPIELADSEDRAGDWFARRSPGFRKSIRQAERRALRAGVTFELANGDPGVFERCVEIERRSWKGQENDGITSPAMFKFYELMTARLQRRGRLRAMVAQLDGEDVGYILGGVRGSTYRGLQLSYVEDARHLSISHLLQYRTIMALTDQEPQLSTYDLGMDMPYKQRWADRSVRSVTLLVERRGGVEAQSIR